MHRVIRDLSGRDYQILRVIWDHYHKARTGSAGSHYVSRGKIIQDLSAAPIKALTENDIRMLIESVDLYLLEFSEKGVINIEVSPVAIQQGYVKINIPPVPRRYSEQQLKDLDYLSEEEKKAILMSEEDTISFINLTIEGIQMCSRLFSGGEMA